MAWGNRLGLHRYSADDALRRYVRLRDATTRPRGMRSRAVEGWVYADRCPGCNRFRTYVERWSKRYGYRVLCSSCGSTWPRVEAWIPPGVIDARVRPGRSYGKQHCASTGSRRRSRVDVLALRLAELASLERLLSERPLGMSASRWRFVRTCWAYYVLVGMDHEHIAHRGRVMRRGRHVWSAETVKRAIAKARQVVDARIERLESLGASLREAA